MAKGFKVLANTPDVSQDDFNLEEAKQISKGKSVVFCLPGTLRRLRKITKQWPGVRIVMITTEKVIKKLKKVEYVPNIDVWHA